MNVKGVIVNYDVPGGSGGRQGEVRQYEGVAVYDHDGTTVLRRPLGGRPRLTTRAGPTPEAT